MRRFGKTLTGVDRVELAYLRALLADPVPIFCLIRSPFGYILLDEPGARALETELSGPREGAASANAREIWRRCRKLSVARALPPFLGPILERHLPSGSHYFNVGHSNLTKRVLQTMQRSLGARIMVFVHDVIPLEFPEFQRAGTVEPFRRMLERVEHLAHLVIYNSHDTRARAEAHMRVAPASIVAHLGTDKQVPMPGEVPDHLKVSRPYFLCIGTIEPRKNHAFLLDIWEEMGADAPGLVIAGSRGWKNEAVFSRLDSLPADSRVTEIAGLSDGALAALVKGSSGVLFPTHAEGYGLPAIESAAQGVPVIVNDLEVFRETLGQIPVYASVSDRYLWINNIKKLAAVPPATSRQEQFNPPTWDAHFKTVLSLT